MKRTVLSLFVALLCAGFATAQSGFEGVITYQIKVTGENADQMAAFMPTSYEYKVSGSNLKFKMVGGMTAAIMGDIVINGKTNEVYMVKANEKTAYLFPENDAEDADTPKPKIEKQNETSEIVGYTCQKYKVTTRGEDGADMVQYMWITDQIKISKPADRKNSGGIFVEGMDGFPLKIQSETMGMNMVMTVSEVNKKAIPASEFQIPSDYEVKDFDPNMFGR
jgi:hypothetical protein